MRAALQPDSPTMCLNRIDFVAKAGVPQGMVTTRAFRARKTQSQRARVRRRALRRSICSMISATSRISFESRRERRALHLTVHSLQRRNCGTQRSARYPPFGEFWPGLMRRPARTSPLGRFLCITQRRRRRAGPFRKRKRRVEPRQIGYRPTGCDHCRNHRPSFIPVMNGRPRCRRQPTTSKPSIPSSGVRSSTVQREDWRRRRCW